MSIIMADTRFLCREILSLSDSPHCNLIVKGTVKTSGRSRVILGGIKGVPLQLMDAMARRLRCFIDVGHVSLILTYYDIKHSPKSAKDIKDKLKCMCGDCKVSDPIVTQSEAGIRVEVTLDGEFPFGRLMKFVHSQRCYGTIQEGSMGFSYLVVKQLVEEKTREVDTSDVISTVDEVVVKKPQRGKAVWIIIFLLLMCTLASVLYIWRK